MLRAVRKHVTCKWALLYIERWLTASMEQDDGTRTARTRGTPQGGVISPILSNLFLHYTFDLWMTRTTPTFPGVGMLTTGWYTVGPSKKLRSSRPDFKRG